MEQKLRKIYLKAESEKEEALQLVQNLSIAQIRRSPRPGKWSISQILSHIIEAERISVAYMQKKSLGIQAARNSGSWDELKFIALMILQRLPLKYKAPRVLAVRPPDSPDYTELRRRWNEVRQQLEVLLENIGERDIRKRIYKHAIVGRLNVMHAMRFFIEHLKHHLPQIQRLL